MLLITTTGHPEALRNAYVPPWSYPGIRTTSARLRRICAVDASYGDLLNGHHRPGLGLNSIHNRL
jgi:hypothetical protein